MVAPTNCGPTLPSQPRAASPPRRCGQQGPRQRRWGMADKPNVVIVHGGFVDGSGWQGVYDLLTADGYEVSVVQNSTLSLEGDAAATRMILDRQKGPTILAPVDGFLFLDRDKFHASFAGDLSAEQAAFMADSQVPWGVEALGGTISEAAWRSKPSWYLITKGDLMIPPDAQKTMCERLGATVVEVDASHSVYVSQPGAVADVIKQAAAATVKETAGVS